MPSARPLLAILSCGPRWPSPPLLLEVGNEPGSSSRPASRTSGPRSQRCTVLDVALFSAMFLSTTKLRREPTAPPVIVVQSPASKGGTRSDAVPHISGLRRFPMVVSLSVLTCPKSPPRPHATQPGPQALRTRPAPVARAPKREGARGKAR